MLKRPDMKQVPYIIAYVLAGIMTFISIRFIPHASIMFLLTNLLIISGLAGFYFYYKNDNRDYIHWVFVGFVMTLLSAPFVVEVITPYVSYAGFALFFGAYTFRLNNKPSKVPFDYMKLLAVAGYIIICNMDSESLGIGVLLLGFTFVYDRLIVQNNISKMKKVFFYLGSVLVTIFFIVYAFIKAEEANKHTLIAEQNLLQAEKNLNEADRQLEIAETNAIEVELLRKALEDCNQ